MANEAVSSLDSNLRLLTGHTFKQQINKLICTYIKDRDKAILVKNSLLSHEYLSLNEPQLAEQRYNSNREKTIRRLLDELKIKIKNNSIKQIIPSDITGQRELSADKLDGKHDIEFLNTSNDDLIIKVERHPNGGRSGPIHQFWLYHHHENLIYLIPYFLKEMLATFGPIMVLKKGKLQLPDNKLQKSFEKIIKKKMGYKALKEFRKINEARRHSSLLNNLPQQVNDFCLIKLNMDINQLEREAREKREDEYISKYGIVGKPDILWQGGGTKIFSKY